MLSLPTTAVILVSVQSGARKLYLYTHTSLRGYDDGDRGYDGVSKLYQQLNRVLAASPTYPPTPSPSTLSPTMGPTITPAVTVQYTVTASNANPQSLSSLINNAVACGQFTSAIHAASPLFASAVASALPSIVITTSSGNSGFTTIATTTSTTTGIAANGLSLAAKDIPAVIGGVVGGVVVLVGIIVAVVFSTRVRQACGCKPTVTLDSTDPTSTPRDNKKQKQPSPEYKVRHLVDTS